MPLYDYKCPMCGIQQGVFKRIADLELPEPCERCKQPMVQVLSAPAVFGDYPGYECPITGNWIEGRKAHLENLKKHGCRLLEPGEREGHAASLKAADDALDKSIDHTVEEFVTTLPARKREQFFAEVEGGVDVQVTRATRS